MELRNNGSDRQLGEPFTCRYYQDNHEQITEISMKTGRPVREVARDLMDEACRRYLSTGGDNGEIMQKLDQLMEQNRVATERYEQLIQSYEELDKRSENLKQGLMLPFYLASHHPRTFCVAGQRLVLRIVGSAFARSRLKRRPDS